MINVMNKKLTESYSIEYVWSLDGHGDKGSGDCFNI